MILLLEALTHKGQSKDKNYYKNNASYSDGDYIDFYRNPYNHLKKLFVHNDHPQDELPDFYVVNAPSDCFFSDIRTSSEKADIVNSIIQEDIQNNISSHADKVEFPPFEDNYKVFLTTGERYKEATDNKTDFDFILKDFYSENDDFYERHKSSYKRKHVDLKVVNDSFEIIVKNTWRFICFNTPLPSEKKFMLRVFIMSM